MGSFLHEMPRAFVLLALANSYEIEHGFVLYLAFAKSEVEKLFHDVNC